MSEDEQADAGLEPGNLVGDESGLAALRTLAGGVAHDFNNLLAVILSCAEFAELAFPPGSSEAEALQDARAAALKAADLCKLILAFAGKRSSMPAVIDFPGAIQRATTELAAPDNVRVEVVPPVGTPLLTADPGLIDQLIRALIDNAIDACRPGGGNVVVSLATSGSALYLDVRDDGIGMNAATQARAFEPFFTTKFPKRGLGLSAAHGIVRSHEGTIEITSAPEAGTHMRVTLPTARKRNGRRRPTTRPIECEGPRRVLVVDDEDLVARSAARILRAGKYEVSIVHSGQEALARFEAGRKVELVVLDMTMPGLDGAETFRELRKMQPDVRVLLTSGYSHLDATEALVATGHCWFLAKPYQADQLLALTDDILA